MIDLTKLEDIKAIQNTLRNKPITDPDVMALLEQLGGWYDFAESDRDMVMIGHGSRRLIATLKTLLKFPADEVQRIVKATLQ